MEPQPSRLSPPTTQALVTVTERAAQELKAAIAAQTETYEGIRLGVSGGGCCGPGYLLALAEKADADDVIVESQGIKIFIERDQTASVQGAKLDFVETPAGSGFHVDNPNVVKEEHGGCACGSGGGGCGCGSGHGGHGHGGHGGESGCGC
jgi:iron-sulfur cluster assembly accessory protein